MTKKKTPTPLPDLTPHLDFLGRKVKDRVSGFTGVCESVHFDLFGCITVESTPVVDKDGKMVDGVGGLDIHRLDVVQSEHVMGPPKFEHTHEHLEMLGQRFRDRITGFEGVLSSIAFMLYGQILCLLSPAAGKDGKKPSGNWFNIQRLFLVDKTHVMPVPAFATSSKGAFGPTPAQHVHGPDSDKPLISAVRASK